jgi:hypothetical protein
MTSWMHPASIGFFEFQKNTAVGAAVAQEPSPEAPGRMIGAIRRSRNRGAEKSSALQQNLRDRVLECVG